MSLDKQATQTTEDVKPPVEDTPESSPDPTGEEALRLLETANSGQEAAAEKKELEKKPLKTEPAIIEDPRTRISKGHRERRKAEMSGDLTDINKVSVTAGTNVTGDGTPPADQQQQQAQPPVKKDEPVRREVELIVDGKTVKQMLTDEELVTAAKATLQKEHTADYRLQNATKLMREAETRLAAMDGTAPPTNAGDKAPTQTGAVPTRKADDAPTDQKADADQKTRLTDIANRLQVGSTEEAVAALGDLVKAVAPQQPVDVDQKVQEAIRRDRDLNSSTEAMMDFAKTHGAAFSKENDPDGVASYVFKSVIIKNMITDMKAAGYTDEVLDHYKLRDPQNEEALKVAHGALRQNGNHGIRSVKQILDAAAKDEQFVKYAKTGKIVPQVAVDRQDRKDGLPQQPAQRGAPPLPAAKTAEEGRTANLSSAVAAMRKSRGQTAVV